MSFLEEVHAKRQKLADVLADEDYSGIREIVEELYPDRAHFIYELLQNAEDAGATAATFTLDASSISFEHNGRPFTEENVWGITNIGKGTKRNQEDQIGRFGVGFKAVFAYSENPHIWSPNYSFRISQLVLPTEISPRQDLGQKTHFEFPFNSPKKSTQVAYDEVKAGLEELSETTLLFLSHLRSIRWTIGQALSGEVLRIEHSDHHIEVVKRTAGKAELSSHFLRVSRSVKGLEKQFVSVAFAIDFLPNSSTYYPQESFAKQFKIIPANPGRVAIYFPADKENSGLRFHLHAPFIPELSRASVKDSTANEPLFSQLADLAAESLHHIRQSDLLTVDFLAVLPNPQDMLPPRYSPIRTAIFQEMNNQFLTPTYSRSHAPAKSLLQAKASLKDLLTMEDIAILIGHDEQRREWAVSASQRNSNSDRFLSGLDIAEWDVDKLLEVLRLKATKGLLSLNAPPWYIYKPDVIVMTWLGAKSPDWHQQMYALLYNEIRANREYERRQLIAGLKGRQIVRLANGKHGVGPMCFFPTDGIPSDELLPQVDKEVYSSGNSKVQQDDARKFLEEIGVREVSESDQITTILKRRYACADMPPDETTYWNDMKRFMALVETANDQSTIFSNYFIFRGDDEKMGQPAQYFLDSPLLETGLTTYFSAFGTPPPKRPLAYTYNNLPASRSNIVKFAELVGVQYRLDIKSVSCHGNPNGDLVVKAPGVWITECRIDKDYTIENLARSLETHDEALSRLIWKTACEQMNTDWLQAQYRRNKSYPVCTSPSQLVCVLSATAWVPQTDGTFVRPCDASRQLLPKGFPFDEGYAWLKAIHFGEQERHHAQELKQTETAAKELGFADKKTLERARQFAALPPTDQERILNDYRCTQQAELPEHESRNPERRAERIAQQAADAPNRTTEERSRTVSIGREEVKQQAGEYLREQYTIDGKTICQICKEVLPFKLDDGTYYFEKVEFLENLKKRYYQNYVALCPNHSAMFQYANGSRAQLRDIFLAMSGQQLEVVIAHISLTIYFTKTHIADLSTVIKIDGVADCAPAV